MRFLVIVPADEASEAGTIPDPSLFEAMGRFNQDMIDAGVMLAAEGLHPSNRGVKVRFDGGATTVIDGPFTETKELIGGFWIIQVSSRDEAIAWMRRAPFGDGVELQLREVYEFADLADRLPADLIAGEQRQRASIAKPS